MLSPAPQLQPMRAPTSDPAPVPAVITRTRAEQQAREAARQSDPVLDAAPRDLIAAAPPLAGFGRPLPPALRGREEARLGADLSRLRLHDGAAAADILRTHSARALTHGRDIAVRPCDARADTPDRLRLLRHEIGHAVQQSQPGAGTGLQLEGDGRGIGRSPPEAAFVSMDGPGAEDDFALFAADSADLTAAARRTLASAAERQPAGQLVVHVHGFASTEGDGKYNRNLSAHRAAAIREALAPLLPQGTRFTLYAHGETDSFGPAPRNRRAGIDFISPEDGSYLALPGPLSAFPRRPRLHLLPPEQLALRPPENPLAGPEAVPVPEPEIGPVPAPDAARGPRLPPQPANLWRAPPPFFKSSFNYLAMSGEYARRGQTIPLRDAEQMRQHFEFWRLRFFQWGLSPDWATEAAQFGTDFAFGTQIAGEFPSPQESLDRRMGTTPKTITILNESRAIRIFEFFRDLTEGEKSR